MGYTTVSQFQLGQKTARNSEIITTSLKNFGGVTITSIIVTDNNYNNLDDTAVGTSNSFIKIIGSGFSTNANVFISGTQVPVANVTLTNSGTELRVALPFLNVGTNNQVSVFNTTGSGAVASSSLFCSGFPVFTTTSYNAGSLTVSVQLLATGDGTLTYALKSGSSLPEGLTLSSTGLISGTVTGDLTTSFIVLVNDSQNQTTQQDISFSVTSTEPFFKNDSTLLQADGVSDNANNNVYVDSSTNNFPMTAVGIPIQGTFNPFGTGIWSNYFSGAPYLSLTNTGGFGSSDFTLEFWMYALNNSAGYLFNNRTSGTGADGFDITTTLQVTTSGSILLAATSVPVGTWTHVAFVRSSGVLKRYINGTNDDSVSTAGNFNGSAFYIGGSPVGNIGYFTGYISNFRHVDSAVYTTTFTPSTTPLTAVSGTKLLTCLSNGFIDKSTYSNVISTTGAPIVDRFNPCGINITPYNATTAGSTWSGSTLFDGSTARVTVPANAAMDFGTGDFTVEFWTYFSDISADRGFLGGSGTNNFDFCWRTSTGLNVGRIVTGFDYTFAWTPKVNSWYHVAYSRSGGSLRAFVDGVQVGTTQSAGATSYNSVGTVCVGGSTTSDRPMFGYISNLRVVSGTALYTTTFTPSTTPLTAVSGTGLLLKNTNAGLYDGSLQNNWRTYGDAKVSTSTYKYPTGSIYLPSLSALVKPLGQSNKILANEDFTFECWFNVAAFNINVGTIYSCQNTEYLAIRNAEIEWQTPTVAINYIIPSATAGQWYHLAISRSGSSIKMFLNGTQVGTTTSTAAVISVGSTFYIGAYAGDYSAPYTFNGYLDDLRITKGYARYTANFTVPTKLPAS